MHLKGWVKPLPQFLVDAVFKGEMTIHYEEKGDYEYLKGKTVNPETKTVIEFL